MQVFASVIFMALTFFFGLLIANFIALLWLIPVFGSDTSQITNFPQLAETIEGGRLLLLKMQTSIAFLSFIVFPLIYLRFFDPVIPVRQAVAPVKVVFMLLVPLILLVIMPAYSPIVEWNAALEFSGFLAPLGEIMREKENEMQKLTIFITDFQTNEEIIWGFAAVSLSAGIGEEFFFRGVLQNKLIRYGMNEHAAVWLAAIIFSAIHFQFFGFFPRVLLGALFGYLFLWSGNIIYPIIGHIFHNGFTLLMMLLFQQKLTDYDIAKSETMPFAAVVTSFLLSAALLYIFKNGTEKIKFNQTEFDN
jgi:membrane protease YdiL (CAAX protease family)